MNALQSTNHSSLPQKIPKYNAAQVPDLKFTDPAKLDNDINSYFESISATATDEDTGKQYTKWLNPPTIVGLANFLDCNYTLIYDYHNENHKFHPQITPEISARLSKSFGRAIQKIHEFTAGKLFSERGSAQGPIFVLKNNFGWKDESIVQQHNTVQDERLDLSKLTTEELRTLLELQTKCRADSAESPANRPVAILGGHPVKQIEHDQDDNNDG